MKRAFALLMMMSLAATAFAQDEKPMVVIVDVDAVYLRCSMGQQLGAKLQQFQKDAEKEIQPKLDQGQEWQNKLNDASTPAAERANLTRNLEELGTELKRYREDKTREAQQMEKDGLAQIEEKLKPVLTRLAKEKGWDVMLNRIPNLVIMAGPRADVTDIIIAEFNKVTAQ